MEGAKREAEGLARRQGLAQDSGTQLGSAHQESSRLAAAVGISVEHRAALGELVLPDGVRDLRAQAIANKRQLLQAAETRRREQLGVVRKRMHELARAERSGAGRSGRPRRMVR